MIGENGLLDHPMSDMMSAGGLRYLPGPRSDSGGGARVMRHPPAKGSHPCRDGIFSERCFARPAARRRGCKDRGYLTCVLIGVWRLCASSSRPAKLFRLRELAAPCPFARLKRELTYPFSTFSAFAGLETRRIIRPFFAWGSVAL